MNKDPILEAYLIDKCVQTTIISLLAVLVSVICAYFRVHVSIIILLGAFIVVIWGMYLLLCFRIQNGSFLKSAEGKQAFARWFTKQGGRRIDGMNLPG